METEPTGIDRPRPLAMHLPAIFQEQAERLDSPLRALLELIQEQLSTIDRALGSIPLLLDPRTAPAGQSSQSAPDFLGWLAGWVDMTLPEGGPAVDESEPQYRARWQEDRLRELVRNAAQLYRRKGTVEGLQLFVAALYDVDVEILEWAAPPGLVVGTRSSIGIDSFLSKEPELDRSFVIIWPLPFRYPQLDNQLLSCLDTPLSGTEDGGASLTLIWKSPQSLPAVGVIGRLRRLAHLIGREAPAHTDFYLAIRLETEPTGEERELKPLSIGVDSVIGVSFISEE